MLFGISACQPILPLPGSTSTTTPLPVVSVDKLQFKDSETGQQFRSLDRCIRNIVDNSWKTTSYQLGGNFYKSSWCSGSGVRSDCQVGESNIDDRDQHVLELNTLFYDQNYPQVFGLGLRAIWVPKSTGWGASYFFAEEGAGVVGDGWQVTFRQYTTASGPSAASVDLGWNYSYTIEGPNQTPFEYPSILPLREDLAIYLSSPEGMRDRGLAQIMALAEKVNTALNTHQVNTCDLGPYLGGGIPPACSLRPLTQSEEAAALEQADTYFSTQEQLLRDHYQEMYAAWMMAFPFDQCWP